MGATRGEAGEAVLAYQVEVTNDDNVRDAVFIDAQTGKALNRWSMVHDALDRELYEATGTRNAAVLTRVWKEGDAVPGHPQRRPAATWSTPPASPTGSTRTPSAATPTTARAPR